MTKVIIAFVIFFLVACSNQDNYIPKSYVLISNLFIDVATVEIINRTNINFTTPEFGFVKNIDLNDYELLLKQEISKHLKNRFYATGIIGSLIITIEEAGIYYFPANKSRSYFYWINKTKSGNFEGKLLFRIKINLLFNNPLIEKEIGNHIFIIKDFNLTSKEQNNLAQRMQYYLDRVIRDLQDQTGINLIPKIKSYLIQNINHE